MRQVSSRVLKLNIFAVLASAVALAMIAVAPASAQVEVTGLPVLFDYAMDEQRTSDFQLVDSSDSLNHGNLVGFDTSDNPNGVEDSGTRTFLSFNGDNQYVWTDQSGLSPAEFVLEVEFRTTTPGGKLIGFEDRNFGQSVFSDRLIYLLDDGRVRFAGASSAESLVTSSAPVTDGEWHTVQAVIRFESSEVVHEMFLDGVSQGTSIGNLISNFPGFWRIGGGTVSGWEGASGEYFFGDISGARLYDAADLVVTPQPEVDLGDARPTLLYEMDSEQGADGIVLDSSGSADHGNLFGFEAPGLAFGEDPIGDSYLSFNGSTDHVWSTVERLSPDNYALEVEFRTSKTGGKVIGFEDQPITASSGWDRHLYIGTDGTLRFGGSAPTAAAAEQVTISSLDKVNDGLWHKAVAISSFDDGVFDYELYLDGVLQSTSSSAFHTVYSGHWRVGGGTVSNWPSAGTDGQFLGDIRRAVVYDTTPVGEPIEDPINVAPVEPTVNPVLHIDPAYDGRAPESIADLSPSENFATQYFFDDRAAALTRGDTGLIDRYVSFDGVDDVLGTDHEVSSISDMTMAVWFRAERAGGKIVGFEDSIAFESTMSDRNLYLNDDGLLAFGIEEASGDRSVILSREPVLDDDWHVAIITMETLDLTTRLTMYIDGIFQVDVDAGLVSGYLGYWREGSGNLEFWPGVATPHFAGDIGPLRIYDEVLSLNEISWLGLPPEPVAVAPQDLGPSLWLDAADDTGAASVMFDQSGNENYGFLHNFDDPESAFHDIPGGFVSRYLSFDGVDDIVVTSRALDTPINFTMAVWFRTEGTTGKIAGFESALAPINGVFADRHMYIDGDGYLHFGMSGGTLETARSAETVNDGEWHLAVGVAQFTGGRSRVDLYIDSLSQGFVSSISMFDEYVGGWRMGAGNLEGWPGVTGEVFEGDIGSLQIYDRALTADQVVALSSGTNPQPTPTPLPFPTPDLEHETFFEPRPRVDVSGKIDGDQITLDINFLNVEAFGSTVWVVRDDGEEFIVGSFTPQMTWEGEAITSRYRVEARQEIFDELEPGEDPYTVIASGSLPVIARPAGPAQIAIAVALTVSVAATVSATSAAASGTWIYDFLWRFLRIAITEKVRRRTKKLDVTSVPSWIAAVLATMLMAVLIAAGKPGALGLRSFPEALVVSTPAVIIFRSFTLLGGVALAYYTHQRPRYLIWAAGTASFAFSSLVLHSPFGYTGYLDRTPGDPTRDARFTLAGFSAVMTLSGLFMIFGLMSSMAFAETGVTLTLGVLAVMMLPFPLMAGNNIWKWNRVAGVASGMIGMVPYILFQYGLLGPTAIVMLATVGLLTFGAVMILELWIAEEKRLKESAAEAKASTAPAPQAG